VKLECIGLIMNTSECILCKSPAIKTIKEGNPKYIGKLICNYCDTYRHLLMKEDTKDEKLWRKIK